MIKIVHCTLATYVLLAHKQVCLFGASLSAEENRRTGLFLHTSILFAPRVVLQI